MTRRQELTPEQVAGFVKIAADATKAFVELRAGMVRFAEAMSDGFKRAGLLDDDGQLTPLALTLLVVRDDEDDGGDSWLDDEVVAGDEPVPSPETLAAARLGVRLQRGADLVDDARVPIDHVMHDTEVVTVGELRRGDYVVALGDPTMLHRPIADVELLQVDVDDDLQLPVHAGIPLAPAGMRVRRVVL